MGLIYGQDWASYQGPNPSASGLAFVFIKTTEGLGYVNPQWVSQKKDIQAAGGVVGYYHYPHMHDSAFAEADYFLSVTKPTAGEMVALDWEGYDSSNAGLSNAQKNTYKDNYLKYLKSKLPNNPVGMYANLDYWYNVDTSNYYGDFLWIATTGRAAGDPGIKTPWVFHQYDGATIDKDCAKFNSVSELKQWVASFAKTNGTGNGVQEVITNSDAQLIAQTVLNLDGVIAAPPTDPNTATNKFWTLQSYIKNTNEIIRAMQAKLDQVEAELQKVSTPTVDANALAAAIVLAMGKKLDS